MLNNETFFKLLPTLTTYELFKAKTINLTANTITDEAIAELLLYVKSVNNKEIETLIID